MGMGLCAHPGICLRPLHAPFSQGGEMIRESRKNDSGSQKCQLIIWYFAETVWEHKVGLITVSYLDICLVFWHNGLKHAQEGVCILILELAGSPLTYCTLYLQFYILRIAKCQNQILFKLI